MKHHLLLAVALAGISSPAWALELVRISGTKKTLDKRESSAQAMPRGHSTLTQKQVVYAFSLQRMSPEVPEKARVAWILMKEQKDGRLVEAARGESAPTLPLGREVTLESAPVLLEEREWTGNKNANAGSIASNSGGLWPARVQQRRRGRRRALRAGGPATHHPVERAGGATQQTPE
jgi:hypothetical protein